jgi:hypothetical protein
MITNESFLENVKKIMSVPASSDSFINLTDLVEKFQEERLERVLSKNLTDTQDLKKRELIQTLAQECGFKIDNKKHPRLLHI